MTEMNSRNFLTLSAFLISISAASAVAGEESTRTNAGALVPLNLKLPSPAFVGTPKDLPPETNVEPPSKTPPPPIMVPADVRNIAPEAKIACSDPRAAASVLSKLTDGNKDAIDANIALLRKGTQYVQFDLGANREIYAIAIWHAHDAPKVYRDVIVQAADDPEFASGVRTLFNNDTDNSSGRGAGTDREYFETNQGKAIDAKGVNARYLRLYSRGSTDSALNEYTEVEIYARP